MESSGADNTAFRVELEPGLARLGAGASDVARGGRGGLKDLGDGRAGRESCEYVTAGMVPSPIEPLEVPPACEDSWPLMNFPFVEFEQDDAASCRDTRRASSRSILSLHWSSNSLRASIKALSVSVFVAYIGRALLALWS